MAERATAILATLPGIADNYIIVISIIISNSNEPAQRNLCKSGSAGTTAHVRIRLRMCMRSRRRERIHARKHKSARAF